MGKAHRLRKLRIQQGVEEPISQDKLSKEEEHQLMVSSIAELLGRSPLGRALRTRDNEVILVRKTEKGEKDE